MSDLYATTWWRKTRKRKLKEEPLCRECLKKGKVVAATEVDHIKPHREEKDLFFDYDNLQSLCKSCHSVKTNDEKKNKPINYYERFKRTGKY